MLLKNREAPRWWYQDELLSADRANFSLSFLLGSGTEKDLVQGLL